MTYTFIPGSRYAKVAASELPGAEVIWYDRGGVHRCMPAALTCSSFDDHGVCTEKKEARKPLALQSFFDFKKPIICQDRLGTKVR